MSCQPKKAGLLATVDQWLKIHPTTGFNCDCKCDLSQIIQTSIQEHENKQHDKNKALPLAVIAGHLPMVECLLLHNANANVEDQNNVICLASKQGHLRIVQCLIENKANPHVRNQEPFYLAATNGHLWLMDYLITRQKVEILGIVKKRRIIEKAAEKGEISSIRHLVQGHGVSLGSCGGEALCRAAQNGHRPVVEYLLEKKVDIHVHKDAPLCRATESGQLAIVKCLLENKASIDALVQNGALQRAIERGHWYVVDYVLDIKSELREHFSKLIQSKKEQQELEKSLPKVQESLAQYRNFGPCDCATCGPRVWTDVNILK